MTADIKNRAVSDANTIDRHVGERIRRRRILLGLTQDQLADALGISYQQIQKYETGANRISAGRLAQIAEVLDVQAGWFFGAAERNDDAAVSSRAVLELIRNFSRIEDERVRSHIMGLVRALSFSTEPNGASDELDYSSDGGMSPASPRIDGGRGA